MAWLILVMIESEEESEDEAKPGKDESDEEVRSSLYYYSTIW
jgi:hypothetical protein